MTVATGMTTGPATAMTTGPSAGISAEGVGAPAATGLPPEQFRALADMIESRAAITLPAGKEYLVETRLAPLARERGISLGELATIALSPAQEPLRDEIVEALTTNETLWFRDVAPWDALRTVVLPEIIERRAAAKHLRVWCGASSSGQEPYSLSMLLDERFGEIADWRRELVGTDLSEQMLDRCRAGTYSALEVNRGLPATHLVRYLERAGRDYQVVERLRAEWDFRPLNLARPFPPLPRADLVMLRNVLIYFTDAVKSEVLGRVRSMMDPDGWLFLGTAESTINLDDAFERVPAGKAIAFRLRDRPSAR